MKIDFNATYRELSRITKASLKRQDGTTPESKFPNLLSGVSPQSTQLSKNIEELPAKLSTGSISIADSFPRASLKALLPNQKIEELGRLTPLDPRPDQVKDAAPRVKTPALLSVRRVDTREEGDSLSTASAPDEPRASLAAPVVSKAEVNYSDVIVEAGKKHGVDPSLSLSVALAESSLNPKAVSSDGLESKGLFQLLDSTGKHLLERSGEQGPYDPFNPQLNVDLGVGYLRYLHDLFSKDSELPNKLRTSAAANSSSLEKLAVAAFNAGEGRVASAQQRAQSAGLDPSVYENVEPYLPETTKEYVKKVQRGKRELEARLVG